MKYSFFICIAVVCLSACNSDKTSEQPAAASDSTAATTTPAIPEAKPLPDLPSQVAFKNWEIGDPQNLVIVSDIYKAWDSENSKDMSSYFADSTAFDFPDGRRAYTTSKNAEQQFRKWRANYKHTSNISFSLISLHNKDANQDWVISWTWNKWQDDQGKKDSMLYCDNWRLKNGKIEYLNSLEQRPSKKLANTLNEKIPK